MSNWTSRSPVALLMSALTVVGQLHFRNTPFERPPVPGYDPYGYADHPSDQYGSDVKTGNLSCYSCSLDFKYNGYSSTHHCLGLHGGTVDPEYLEKCGVKDQYCQVDRIEVGGVLTILSRSCSDHCFFGCRPRGFGINIEACSDCCNTDGCNDFYPIRDIGGPRRGPDGRLLNSGASLNSFCLTAIAMTGLAANWLCHGKCFFS